MINCTTFLALAVLAFPASAIGATVSAVDWGGPYVGADLLFSDDVPANRSGSDSYGDPDGPITVNVIDSIAGRGLSLTRPFNPSPGYSGQSGTFYGGGSVTRTNSLTNDGFSELSVLNQGPDDSIHWHVDTGGDDHTFHLLLAWDKSGFLGDLATTPNLDLSEGEFSLSTSQVSGHHTDELLHWVVRDGAQFYVSESTITLSNNSNYTVPYSSLTNWGLYNPATVDPAGTASAADLFSLDFDESGSFSPHAFTDVTALGFYVEHEAATGPIHVHVEGFGATLFSSAPAIPEPSTLTFAVLGFLVLLKQRRRRA